MAASTNYDTSYKSLFWFSLPSVAATLVEPFVEIVDSAIIGPISPAHLSALSANGAIFSVSVWIFNFLVHVGSAEVASSYGQNNTKQLREGILLGLSIPLIVGTLVGTSLYFLSDVLLLGLMNLDPSRLALAEDYYFIRLYSLPFALLLSSCSGILRGLGKVKSAFMWVLAMTAVNAGLTVLLVKVYDMGLKGAALGSLVSLAATSVPVALYLARKYLRDVVSIVRSIDLTYLKSYLSNSYNQFLRTVAISSSFFISAAVANASGAITGASHQVLLHYWLLASYVLDGFSVTATTMGADLWFSKRYKEWFVLAKRLLIMSVIVGAVFSSLYLLFPNLIYLFTRSQDVYEQTLSVWLLLALFQTPNSLLYTFDGLFFSQKNFKYIRIKLWQGFIFGFLPVILLTGKDNLMGIWVAICALNSYRFFAFSYKLLRQKKEFT
ncbi:MATE family efflux transporter [bacterium]|nr:MATE family efflux transporter [bacterium]